MSNISYFAIITLILMKLRIFFKEYPYSIIAPLVSSIIFIVILKTISSYYNLKSDNSNFINFVVPGILVMVVMQETFSNVSETLILMKQQGTFNDILISPISRSEIATSLLISILFIGIFVSIVNLFVISFFVDIQIYNIWRFLFYLSLCSIFFGSIGAVVGFVSFTWDVQQSIFNLVITPISLLSGTFFSIDIIEKNWQFIFLLNPFYYLITNVRKTFKIDQIYNFYIDIALITLVLIMIFITLYIFKKGYRVIN